MNIIAVVSINDQPSANRGGDDKGAADISGFSGFVLDSLTILGIVFKSFNNLSFVVGW